MFDGVSVPHAEGEVVPPALAVSDEEGPVVVLRKQELLLSLNTLDLPEIPARNGNVFMR